MKTLIAMTLMTLSLTAFASVNVNNWETKGVAKSELQDLRQLMQKDSESKVKTLNKWITVSIEREQITAATELLMERDMEVLNTQNRLAKINRELNQLN